MADQVFGVVLELAYTFHREFLLCQSFDWRSTNAIELHQRWYDVEQPCTTSTRVVQLIITVALESSHCRLWQRSRKQFSMILIHTTNEILRIYCRQWQFKRHYTKAQTNKCVHNRYTMATRLPMFWDVYPVDKELKNWEGESFLRRMFFPYATHLAARWLTTLCFAFEKLHHSSWSSI